MIITILTMLLACGDKEEDTAATIEPSAEETTEDTALSEDTGSSEETGDTGSEETEETEETTEE